MDCYPSVPMIAGHIGPAARVMLDHRIAEERMVALDPPFERPDWLYSITSLSCMPQAFVMGASGQVARRWVLADEVDWSCAVGVRFETPWGKPIDLDDFGDDEDYWQ